MTSSKRKRIFVTGGSGLLGAYLIAALREKHEVYYCFHHHEVLFKAAKGYCLDLTDRNEVVKQLKRLSPEVIIHCAAITDVEYCETHYDEAWRVNAEATGTLARTAREWGAKFIYISTEAVYEGTRGNYSEENNPCPVNAYARSKLGGEDKIRGVGGNWLIARTGFEAWKISPHWGKEGFFEWLRSKFQEGRPIPVFHDRFFTPLSAYRLVSILEEVIQEDIQGLFNIEGIEKCSYVDFAKKVAQAFGFDSSLIMAISMEERPAKVRRPQDTSLNVSRIRSLIETKLPDVGETVQDLKSYKDSGQLDYLARELTNEKRVPGLVSR